MTTTRYEVAVTISDNTVVVGYTARRTKKSLLKTAMDNNTARGLMLASLPEDDTSIPVYTAQNGWKMAPCILIHWTGGTEFTPSGVNVL